MLKKKIVSQVDSNNVEKCLWFIPVTMNMPRAGFEPATTRSSAERSPRLSYLGNFWDDFGYSE